MFLTNFLKYSGADVGFLLKIFAARLLPERGVVVACCKPPTIDVPLFGVIPGILYDNVGSSAVGLDSDFIGPFVNLVISI